MEKSIRKGSRLITDIAACAVWSVFVLIVTGCNSALMNPLRLAVLLLGFTGFACLMVMSAGKSRNEKIIAAVTIIAVAIRTFYVLYTGAQQRQHDMGEFGIFHDYNYHSEYIEYLINNHRLLDENIAEHWQFYHPPLQHITCAVFFSIYKSVAPSYGNNWDALQCLSLFYSLVTLTLAKRFTDLWNLKPKAKTLAYLTVALHPQLIVFSGALNNDPIAVMFAIAALYLTFVWYGEEKKSFAKLMGIGLCVGLGMMGKLSAGIVAVPIGLVMVKAFFESKKKPVMFLQYVAFMAVCAPLGLWYQVRSYVLWKVPITYVAKPDLILNPGLIIDQPAWKRFLAFGDGVDYNIITETLDAAVFDGDYYRDHTLLALIGYLLLSVFSVFVITVFANMVICWIKDRSFTDLVMTVLFLSQLASYVYFCFSYPYTCTMSFRYIVPTVIAGAYYTGRAKDLSPHLLSLLTTASVYALAVISLVFYGLVWIKG